MEYRLVVRRVKTLWKAIKAAAVQFGNDNLWIQAAALSYYTIFALPPMLMIILQSTSLVYERQLVETTLFGVIRETIGRESARQLSQTLDNIGVFDGSWWTIAAGIGGLLFTATTVFVTMQSSLNKIFRIKPTPKSGILRFLRDRLLSLTFLLALGFVLLVSLILNTLISVMGEYLASLIPELSFILLQVLSFALPLVLITLLFAAIFRFLPDARLKRKEVFAGALLTTLLFSIGRYVISFYISTTDAGNLYQAAGSVMIIMLWGFYASVIFLFGAAFTHQFALHRNGRVPPTSYAVKIKQKEIELNE